VTESTTLPLVVLMVLLVVTRPLEERWWKSGRISDRTAAWLIVGRLVVLAAGFGLIVGLDLPKLLLLLAIAAVAAYVLQPIAQGRIARVRAQDRTGPPSR
jgi:hypothetical protein